MNKKINIGILGCADIAKRYSIKAFQNLNNVGVISIASRNYDKAKEWASIFNIHTEESYDSLLKNKSIDALYIPLPIGLHKEWVIRAAKAGKHIICEKSLGENLESVREMIEVCRNNNVILYENFACDFHPQHDKVVSTIKSGGIGDSFIFRSYFGYPPLEEGNIRYSKTLGGGILNDAGAYTVFMARKIFDAEPLSVTCDLTYDDIHEVDIQGVAMLKFPNSHSAIIGFSCSSVYQNNYSVWGSEAVLNVQRAYSIKPDMKPVVEISKIKNNEESVFVIDVSPANQFELIFGDFCDTILNKEYRLKKIDDIYSRILAQAQVMEAMRISARENQSVRVADL